MPEENSEIGNRNRDTLLNYFVMTTVFQSLQLYKFALLQN
jgi:hypothetical protein